MVANGAASARPRLVDVADLAGVSTATASLVLRGRPGPSAATRDAVRGAAAALGYRPDRTASLLARRRTHLLGVLLDVTSAFHAELVRALDTASADRGLDLVLGTTTPRTDEGSAAETLLDFRCEALVLLGPHLPDVEVDALAAHCPTVVVGRAGTSRVPGVLAADDQGLESAVDHLASLGHRRIAHVEGPRGAIATARRQGYRDAMVRHGLGGAIEVLRGGLKEADGVRAGERLLSRPASALPTAVVAYNDRVAIGLRDALQRGGVLVPANVSVVGYDDSPVARLGTIDLTSVSQEPDALAEATVAVLAHLLDRSGDEGSPGGPDSVQAEVPDAGGPGRDIVISPRLVVRSSTAPPPMAPGRE